MKITIKHKTCTKCKQIKKSSDFNKNPRYKTGLSYWCRDCVKLWWHTYFGKHKKKIQKLRKKYKLKNRLKILKQSKKYNNNHKKEHQNAQLKKKFGFGILEYKKLFKLQNGRCAICKKPEKIKRHNRIINLAVDHNHKNGIIRGLLCFQCNRLLGYFDKNPNLLKSILKYQIENKNDIRQIIGKNQ